jgi:hypothetical protein
MERCKGDTETAGLLTEQGKYRQAISRVHYVFAISLVALKIFGFFGNFQNQTENLVLINMISYFALSSFTPIRRGPKMIVQARARSRRLSGHIEIKESRHRWAKHGFDTPFSGLLSRRLTHIPLNARVQRRKPYAN